MAAVRDKTDARVRCRFPAMPHVEWKRNRFDWRQSALNVQPIVSAIADGITLSNKASKIRDTPTA